MKICCVIQPITSILIGALAILIYITGGIHWMKQHVRMKPQDIYNHYALCCKIKKYSTNGNKHALGIQQILLLLYQKKVLIV